MIRMYVKRLFLAFLGRDLVNDFPVRRAQRLEILDLINELPHHIEGSDDKTSVDNLLWMLNRCLLEERTFPVDKTGRWIGFVHGVLALAKHLDVNTVRNRSRPRFHRAYTLTGQLIPETKER